jgi:preprotein translocase subunit SecF
MSVEPKKASIWTRLYNGDTEFDFIGPAKRWFLISALVIVAGLISLGTRQLNLGIDFEGGVVWETAAGEASVEDVRDAVASAGVEETTVQSLRDADGNDRIRVEAQAVEPDTVTAVSQSIAEVTGSDINDISFTSVGPSWGEEISRKALRALVFFLIAITIYISLRFEFKMAVPTLAALLHDILVTIGVYSLTGFEVTPATVIALLTILGYSIYDGIVVFDKVDENTKTVSATAGITYSSMVNRSLNEVLMRSLNTSITALIPVGSLLVLGSFILGATTLQEFALALLIGLFAGAYSSIFIASPLLAILKEREPRYRDIAARIAARGGGRARVAAAVGAPDGEPAAEGETVVAKAPDLSGRVIPPRPRKKGKRR